MKKLQSLLSIGAFIFVISIVPASAVTIDFENVPNMYVDYYPTANDYGTNIGTLFSGVDFGPGATILDSNRSVLYDPINYPPHSGTAVMTTNISGYVKASFQSAPNEVSLYYSSLTPLELQAFTSSGIEITSYLGDPVLGDWGYLRVTSSASDIAYVIIHDEGGFFTVDDFTFNVPEPGILPLLGLALSLIGLVGLRKKFNG